ncbi:hypothetical protein NQZ68_031589 [Dissostichus eleginoides]|nr:hypothetical protein NQZ68_031589 [Dissostichus eleginoides]
MFLFFLLAVLVTGGPCPETSAGDNKLLHTDTLTLMWRVRGPWRPPDPPTPGPIETLHLYPVRLSCLGKVGSAMDSMIAPRFSGNLDDPLVTPPGPPHRLYGLSTNRLTWNK